MLPNLIHFRVDNSYFYHNDYEELFLKRNFVSKLKNFAHKKLEKGVKAHDKVIEIGAGTGHHFQFITHEFKEYHMVDPLLNLRTDITDRRIVQHKKDFLDPTFLESGFDRIIVTCVLHHVSDPYNFLSKVKTALKPGGLFSLYLPTDPSLITFLNRKLIVEPAARRIGVVNYDFINSVEHKNSVYSLNRTLQYMFMDFDIKRTFFPFRFFPFIILNGFIILQIRRRQYD